MNNHLSKIKKNLYEIETILSTDTTVKLLAKYNIDSKKFLDTINLYMKYFNSLENIEDDLLIQMLDEKLDYFVKNSQNNANITLYHAELSTSITFVQDKADKLLNLNSLIDTKNDERLKTDITKPIDSIS
ncbi:MAG: hypothetical protein U9N59_03505, partial [Campylobacterota bacterium]|nr:hypothetical protein [Campylobacterota bacterium]